MNNEGEIVPALGKTKKGVLYSLGCTSYILTCSAPQHTSWNHKILEPGSNLRGDLFQFPVFQLMDEHPVYKKPFPFILSTEIFPLCHPSSLDRAERQKGFDRYKYSFAAFVHWLSTEHLLNTRGCSEGEWKCKRDPWVSLTWPVLPERVVWCHHIQRTPNEHGMGANRWEREAQPDGR